MPIYLNNNDGGVTTAGNLVGPGSLDVGSNFDWTGGTLALDGGVTLEPSSGFKTSGADPKTLSAYATTSTLSSLAQLVDLGGTGSLTITSGAGIDIQAGETDVSLPEITGLSPPPGAGFFTNEANGNLKFDSPTSTLVSINFTNNGILHVAGGSGLTLSAGGGALPLFTVNLDGHVQLDSDMLLWGSISAPTGLIVDAGAGHLKVGDGSHTSILSWPSSSGVSLQLFGFLEVTSTGTLSGGELDNNTGTLILDPGSVVTLSVYTQASTATLELEAASATLYSSMTVTGNARLSGTLKLDFLNGYVPTRGTDFHVLTAGSISAHFDTTPSGMTASYSPTGLDLIQN